MVTCAKGPAQQTRQRCRDGAEKLGGKNGTKINVNIRIRVSGIFNGRYQWQIKMKTTISEVQGLFSNSRNRGAPELFLWYSMFTPILELVELIDIRSSIVIVAFAVCGHFRMCGFENICNVQRIIRLIQFICVFFAACFRSPVWSHS